jgi:hypothetical protein
MSFLLNPFIFTTSAPSCSGDLISTSNLVGYWSLNGASNDLSGNNYLLTNYNSLVVYTSGIAKFSQSGVFLTGSTDPGSARRALYRSSSTGFPNTNSTSAAATYMGWFNFDNLPTTGECYLFSNAKSGQRAVTITYQSTNNIRIQIYDGSSAYQTDYSHTPTTDTWYHYAFTQNAGVFTTYINGVSAHTWTNTNNGNAGGNIFRIGGHEGFNLSFLGHIDDVAVFSRVLSSSEIATVYAGTCPLRSTTMTANTVGYYAFEANENDSTPNARTLTNTSVTWAPGKGGTYSAAFITGSTLVDSATKKLTTSTQIVETVSTSTSGLSVSGWFSLANLPSQVGYTSIAWILAGTSQRGIWLEYTQAGAWRLVFFDGATQYTNAWTTTPTLNQWYHICFVMQPSTGVFNVYFDGVSRISGTNTNNGNSGFSNRLTIGSYDSVARTWLGYIDEFAIWSRPLAYNEVQNLYNSGAGDYYPFTS